MKEITINHRDERGKTTYTLYEKDEAEDAGIDYKYWQNAEVGEYGVTDDGIVAKVIQKTEYDNNSGKKSVYVRFPWGYTLYPKQYSDKKKLLARGRKSAYTLTGDSQWHVGRRKRDMENIALCYAQVFDKDFAIALATGGVSKSKHRSYRRYMRTEKFRQMVREELKKLLEKQELTEEYTLKLLKEGIEIAKDTKDVTNILKAVKNLQELHGMNEKDKVKRTAALEVNQTKRLIDKITQEEERMDSSASLKGEEVKYVEEKDDE